MGMNKDAVQNERQPRNTATLRPENLASLDSERILREAVGAFGIPFDTLGITSTNTNLQSHLLGKGFHYSPFHDIVKGACSFPGAAATQEMKFPSHQQSQPNLETAGPRTESACTSHSQLPKDESSLCSNEDNEPSYGVGPPLLSSIPVAQQQQQP